jgi:hypothetical protein
MIGVRAKAEFNGPKVRKAAETASFKSLGHAAGALRMTARRSIRRRKRPSAVGQPVSTQTGAAKNAIGYDVTKPHGPAVIGPMASRIGPAMKFHEHGGRRGDRYLPRRPVMGPALAQIGPRMSQFWAGRIH